MSLVQIDPLDFEEWRKVLEVEDLLHAFRAIKTLELMHFKATISEDYKEVLDEWASLK